LLWGGEVLHAKRVQEGTVLEILQLPLSQGKPVESVRHP